MNRRVAILAGVLIVAAAGWSGGKDLVRGMQSWHALGPLPPGQEAPPFELYRMEGGKLQAQELHGSVAVMTFWASWCGVCRGELEDLDRLDDEYKDRDDVKFLAVNHEGGGLTQRQAQNVVAHYQRATGLQLPVALDDGTAARAFRVRPIPHTIVFDREGKVRHVHLGRVSASTIRAEVDRLLQDGPS